MTEVYSLEAEQSVLGSILIDPVGAIPKVIDVITADDFYLAPHREIYTAMLDMCSRNNAPDPITVSFNLGEACAVDRKCGGLCGDSGTMVKGAKIQKNKI
jgi:replicative DNA helicase